MGGHVGSAGMNRGEWVARGGPSLNGNPPPDHDCPTAAFPSRPLSAVPYHNCSRPPWRSSRGPRRGGCTRLALACPPALTDGRATMTVPVRSRSNDITEQRGGGSSSDGSSSPAGSPATAAAAATAVSPHDSERGHPRGRVAPPPRTSGSGGGGSRGSDGGGGGGGGGSSNESDGESEPPSTDGLPHDDDESGSSSGALVAVGGAAALLGRKRRAGPLGGRPSAVAVADAATPSGMTVEAKPGGESGTPDAVNGRPPAGAAPGKREHGSDSGVGGGDGGGGGNGGWAAANAAGKADLSPPANTAATERSDDEAARPLDHLYVAEKKTEEAVATADGGGGEAKRLRPGTAADRYVRLRAVTHSFSAGWVRPRPDIGERGGRGAIRCAGRRRAR